MAPVTPVFLNFPQVFPRLFPLPALFSRHPSLLALTCPGSSWPSEKNLCPLLGLLQAPKPDPLQLFWSQNQRLMEIPSEERGPHFRPPPQHAFLSSFEAPSWLFLLTFSAPCIHSAPIQCLRLLFPCILSADIPSRRPGSRALLLPWVRWVFFLCFCSFSPFHFLLGSNPGFLERLYWVSNRTSWGMLGPWLASAWPVTGPDAVDQQQVV